MIGVIDRVDGIFQSTEWSNEYKGYGFEIEEVIVHEKPTPGTYHYKFFLDSLRIHQQQE